MWTWLKNLFAPKKQASTPISKPAPIPEPVPVDNGTVVRGSLEWYGYLWDQAQLREDPKNFRMISSAASKIDLNSKKYKEVALATGVPWWVIGCIHIRESSGSFEGVLHNGERIIGKGVKTRLVPKDRGPFESWEAAAIDALNLKVRPKVWNIEEALRFLERYNGLGYLKFHPEVLSPYLWSGTSLYSGHGKYTSDGKFDKYAAELQCGCVAMIKALGSRAIITRV